MKSFIWQICLFLLLSVLITNTTSAADKEIQATKSQIIKYDLAYPGMLPDNPFYKLKVLRDIITLASTSDPKKKIDFYLLQTDKGILASAILVDKKKIDLSIQTAYKAEHNYTLLTLELGRLPKKPNEDFFDKLKTSSLKHQEVLLSLAKRVAKEKAQKFEQIIDFSKRNWKTVEKYKKGDTIVK